MKVLSKCHLGKEREEGRDREDGRKRGMSACMNLNLTSEICLKDKNN